MAAYNWSLCELALQPERYATLTASTSLLDKHCAVHCLSKRAVDSALLPGSDTHFFFFFFKCSYDMTGKAPNGTGSTIGGVIFFYVSGSKLTQTAPGLITGWQTSLMWYGWLNVNEYQGQYLIVDSLFFFSICGEMSTGQCCCLPSFCPFNSDSPLMDLVSQIVEQNGQKFPWLNGYLPRH